jgi:preprotein translocase subunit SecG
MTTLFVIIIILASAVLGLIVLVQNPKGGGLAGNIAGFSNQFMGVKQTTDVLEKGTWVFGGLIGVLCIVSVFFISKEASTVNAGKASDATGATVPAQSQPGNNTLQIPAAPATTPAATPQTPANK